MKPAIFVKTFLIFVNIHKKYIQWKKFKQSPGKGNLF